MSAADPIDEGWDDIGLATVLFSIDPAGLGGIRLRGAPGPRRDHVLAWVRALLPPEAPVLRVPVHITEDRLLGGIALAETLRAGRVVTEEGLLARANGGVLELAMAERIDRQVLAHLSAALDRGAVTVERDGVGGGVTCQLGVVALDEGIGDEAAPEALQDRLAFSIDLRSLEGRGLPDRGPSVEEVSSARARVAGIEVPEEMVAALCQAAVALGISALRAPLLAARAARAHAAWRDAPEVSAEDVAAAARLVLGPRAVHLPAPPPPAEDEPPSEEEAPSPDEAPDQAPDDAGDDPRDDEQDDAPDEDGMGALDEIVLEAARSGIPAGLLDALGLERAPRGGPRSGGKSGARRASLVGGRPAGTRAAKPGRGQRLNVVETLRAAAPWQRLRGRDGRVEVRASDFRVTRYRQRTETTVIFAVDASGSSAAQRLAEAKGAVEQILADCYVRRDHVALVAFRRKEAALLLPPTRSLTRARRTLAGLPGGGATPLAAGLDAALALARETRRQGRSPLVVVMTDGRANVARDGTEGGAAATEDALESARALRREGIPTLFLDTAPRPRPRARQLAEEMAARYLPLPYLDSAGISREVQSLARDAAR